MKYVCLLLLLPSVWNAQGPSFSLGTATILVGGGAGNGSVQLAASSPTATWTAASNASWLQLAPGSASGTGSALIQFSYAANPNQAPQSGTLTIAGLTLTVTQAGSGYVPFSEISTLIPQGLNLPYGVAVDSGGNLYVADTGDNAIKVWSASTQQVTTLVSAGLNSPHGVAVDGQGNVYIADAYNNVIEEWNRASGQLTTLVSSGLNFPLGVAVDGQGNVYIADFGNNAIKQWSPATQTVTTLVGSGLHNPTGVAVDLLGNVYIADFRNNAIEQWSATTQQLVTLLSTGLSFPNAIALDGQANLYLVDGNNNALKEWCPSTQAVSTLAASGVNGSFGVAADGQGNFYIANPGTSTIQKLSLGYLGLSTTSVTEGPQAGMDSVTVQVLPAGTPLTATSDQSWLTITGTSGGVISFSFQSNTATSSRTAHINVLGQQITVTQTGDMAASLTKSAGDGQQASVGTVFPTTLQVTVMDAGGSPVQGASVTFTVNPGANGAGGTFSATPPMPILTDQNGNAAAPVLTANSIAGPFTVTAGVNGLNATFNLTNLFYMLGSSTVTVGSAAGNGTVQLVAAGPWTATSNAAWLQVSPGSASGSGSAVIQYSYAANTNSAAQTGTLTIGGLTFTVTQAGVSYVPVYPVTPLVSSGLNDPQGVAVDAQDNVYIADSRNNAIKEWSATTQQVTALVSSGLNNPTGVAVDGNGNVYIADSGNNAIKEWVVSTQQVIMLVSSGLSNPFGVAVDSLGNVYFTDSGNSAVKEWVAATQQVTTLVSSGLSNPTGVAVDLLGNVYFADTANNAIKEWSVASQQVTPLVTAGLLNPTGTAVGGQGNVTLAETGNNAIKKWSAATQQVATLLSSGLSGPAGVAVDEPSNVYVADANNNAVKKLTIAYLSLSATSLTEGAQAGSDSVTASVLPASTPLTATSDQSWLTITGISSGVISFSFQTNTSVSSRTAHITVLGQQVTVTQSGDVPASITVTAGNGQSTPAGQVFPVALQVAVTDAGGNPVQGAGVSFSVTPGSNGASGTFSNTPPMPILTDQNGHATAPALMANSIAGQFTATASINALSTTFNLTNQLDMLESSSVAVGSAAGSGSVELLATGSWTATSNAPWLQVSAGSASGSGNAVVQFSYAANTNSAAQTGTLTIAGLTFTVTQAGTSYVPVNPVTALVKSGLNKPQGVAVDAQGNVYIADTGNNAIKEWSAASQTVTTLVSSGLNTPTGVTVDGQGNVYIADDRNNAIKEWIASSQTVTSLVSTGLSSPIAVALDTQGNVYFTDSGHNAIKEYIAATKTVITLVPAAGTGSRGVAVDALGNVYFSDTGGNGIKERNAATKQVTTLVSAGLNGPAGVAVDGQGNVDIADTNDNAIKVWSPSSGTLTTAVSLGLKGPDSVAEDTQGNIYLADTGNSAIKKATSAYLSFSATSLSEGAAAGSDSVTALVLPATTPLTATSNQTWLTITGISSGVIGFSFTANTSVNSRIAQITVLGAVVTVTQSGDTPASITETAGAGQSVRVGHVFPIALQVKIKDAAGNSLQGVAVTFTVVPGSHGAGGTFAPTPPMPIVTGTNGTATAPALTANSIAGQFTVTATAGSLTATFTMTITAH